MQIIQSITIVRINTGVFFTEHNCNGFTFNSTVQESSFDDLTTKVCNLVIIEGNVKAGTPSENTNCVLSIDYKLKSFVFKFTNVSKLRRITGCCRNIHIQEKIIRFLNVIIDLTTNSVV